MGFVEKRAGFSATGKRFAIIVSRFNEVVSTRLLSSSLDCLRRHGCKEDDMSVVWVPGCFEIPFVAKRVAEQQAPDAILCLGAVIRGETPHFEYVSSVALRGISRTAMESGVPVIPGIITADALEQAIQRAGAKEGNKGWTAAMSAIEMANLVSEL